MFMSQKDFEENNKQKIYCHFQRMIFDSLWRSDEFQKMFSSKLQEEVEIHLIILVCIRIH